LDNYWDEAMIEAEREIIGKKQSRANDQYKWMAEKYKKSETNIIDITAPATPEATLWDGWKSHGLKPAYEPILVAMKPNEGSYANNALRWGVAGLNIDGGRIKYKNERDIKHSERIGIYTKTNQIFRNISGGKYSQPHNSQGRYPANVIFDEGSAKMLDEQSGILKSGVTSNNQTKDSIFGKRYMMAQNGSQGGASRFFYCAKASKAERNRGCEGLEEDYKYRDNGFSANISDSKLPRANHHPTIKPLSLMKYLCTLTKTPTGGVMLDPFCGSGTTLMACKETRRKYIGIDNDPEYCEIARKRVNAIPESLF
jgi:site-specific DNA-methyltransferase (adenine-specific)